MTSIDIARALVNKLTIHLYELAMINPKELKQGYELIQNPLQININNSGIQLFYLVNYYCHNYNYNILTLIFKLVEKLIKKNLRELNKPFLKQSYKEIPDINISGLFTLKELENDPIINYK